MMSVTSPSLLIDAGNTALKWALLQGGTLRHSDALVHQQSDLAAELARCWRQFAAPPLQPGQIVLSNVAGAQLTAAISHWFAGVVGAETAAKQLRVLTPQARAYGVSNAYAAPHTLGADRWAGLIAAHHHLQAPACVVDCGTAITVDVISAAGEHLGGIILPGINTMKHSLQRGTHGISNLDFDDPSAARADPGLLGRSTAAAVTAGVHAAASGAIDQAMREARQRLGPGVVGIITGGEARQMLPHLHDNYSYEPDWVLQGLAIVARDPA